ncbi:AraC family transcriptional regulator [Streptomyces sp. VRA16 Mangrove soil]|nr:AraC family transcriptional regulator [Streptomyces sp. VRA16 Mangrove soil]
MDGWAIRATREAGSVCEAQRGERTAHTTAPQSATFEPLLGRLQDHLGRDLTLADIAGRAGVSARTLMRRFREQAGTTSLQGLHRARARQARHLLETVGHPIGRPAGHPVERIAQQVGFGSPSVFRHRFKRTISAR